MHDGSVGYNQCSFFNNQAVANNKIFAVDLHGFSIADYFTVGLCEMFKLFEGIAAAQNPGKVK